MRTATAEVDRHGAEPTYSKPLRAGGMEAPGAWARAHERPTGAAMAAVPRAVRTGCSICQRGASLKITQTQSFATTWDRESKTLMDTNNRTLQRLLLAHGTSVN